MAVGQDDHIIIDNKPDNSDNDDDLNDDDLNDNNNPTVKTTTQLMMQRRNLTCNFLTTMKRVKMIHVNLILKTGKI